MLERRIERFAVAAYGDRYASIVQMRHHLLRLSLVLVVAAACTSAPERSELPTIAGGPTTSTSTSPVAGDDRIVVIDDTGSVVTMNADGEERRVIADEDTGVPFQPTWAPDGVSIAFSSTTPTGPGLVTAVDGVGDSERVETSTNVFYMYWSPDGSRLAALRTADTGGLQLDVLDVETGMLETIDGGQPLYYAWSPESDRLVTHIGTDRLELLDLDGTRMELGPAPGVFPSPQWTSAGIVHLGVTAGDQTLSLTQVDGAEELLATVPGPAIFSANANGSKIAIQSIIQDGTGVNAGFSQAAAAIPAGELVVLDVDSGTVDEATRNPVAAFFWDPTGERLLLLTGDGRSVRWEVWSDGTVEEITEFVPSPTFIRDYLAFFDQYAKSTSLWSPDGTAFVFPGAVGAVDGIWRVDVDGDRDPVRISGGTWAVWSPA